MSLLKIYDSTKIEFEKNYLKVCSTILNVDNYIPGWYYITTDTLSSVLLEILNTKKLKNKTIEVDSSSSVTLTGYNSDTMLYTLKTSQTLNDDKIYRLKITTSSGTLYSDLFKNK